MRIINRLTSVVQTAGVFAIQPLLQDPNVDRVMATLVGSRTPGDSTSVQDIILPSE